MVGVARLQQDFAADALVPEVFGHLFGNGAFRDEGPELVAHARLQGALMSRADTYLARFEEAVGPEEAARVIMLPTDIDFPIGSADE